MSAEPTNFAGSVFLSYDDLAERWGVCSRSVRRIVIRLGLTPIRFGHKTVRFRKADVLKAEERR